MFWDPLVGFQSITILAKNPGQPPESWQVAGHLALALVPGPSAMEWCWFTGMPYLVCLVRINVKHLFEIFKNHAI